MGHLIFDSLDQMLLEAHRRRHSILKVATWTSEFGIVPATIAIRVDLEFDSVVTGSDSSHVPLKLLDFATLVEVSQRDREEECNQDAESRNGGNGVIFVMKDSIALNTSELGKEEGLSVLAASSFAQLTGGTPQIVWRDIDGGFLVSHVLDLGLHGSDKGGLWSAI